MKKTWLSMVFIFFCAGLFAQNVAFDSVSFRKLYENVELLKRNEAMIRQLAQKQRTEDSLRIIELNGEIDKVTNRTNELSSRIQITAKGRYDKIYNNLTATAYLFEEMNKRLNTLQALTQAQNYETIVTQLNNPTDGSLGFSYQSKVIELLDKTIPVQRKSKGKFLEIAGALLKNPIVNGIVSLTPVVNIGSQVLSMVSSFAMNDDNIKPEHITNFKNSLGAYTTYYSKLNDATTNFQVSTSNYKVQINNLHRQLEDYAVLNLQEAGFRVDPKTEGTGTGEYLNTLFRTYNERGMIRYMDGLKAKFTTGSKIDYEKLLNETKLELINGRVDDVTQSYKQFDYLYRQYIAMIEEHNKQTIEIMNYAIEQKLSSDEAKVREKIEQLKQSSRKSVNDIKTSINILQLEDIAKNIVR